MNANVYILTNNSLAAEKYPEIARLLDCGVGGILHAARDEIHLGAVMIGHPLSGSIGIGETPCKSLLLSTRRGALDMQSIQLIEAALEAFRKAPPGPHHLLPPEIIRDFQVIDLDLLDCAIKALPAQYHI